MKIDSVISSTSLFGDSRVASSTSETNCTSPSSFICLTDRFTWTRQAGGHNAACEQARSRIQAPRGTIRPLRSANSMVTAGDTLPNVG
ncbi:hypothetical protein D3C71_1671740 [compost metagenome]